MAEKIKIKIHGEPYFITSNDNRHFNVVTGIEYVPGEKFGNWISNNERKLVLDKDIKEIPTRRLNLLVETLNDREGVILRLIVDECKKLAGLCWSDYVGIEHIGGYNAEFINMGSRHYLRIQPRLFRKILDD